MNEEFNLYIRGVDARREQKGKYSRLGTLLKALP
jgi:hypothetical protein